MMDVAQVQCPYCFELTDISVDPESSGEWVEDCPVCCRPWAVRVARDENGDPLVSLDRAS